MKKKSALIYSFILAVLIVAMAFLNGDSEVKLNYEAGNINGVTSSKIDDKNYVESEEATNLVKIEVENKGIIIAELYPDIAPITVNNFKKLVSEKYYDGIIFHRVIKDFMIQTGDPTGTGSGGSSENIKGEFKENGVENNLSHTRGVLSMARRGSNPDTDETRNSASSQFFIVQKDYPSLDGKYASFGKVIHGMDIVDFIASVRTDEYDKPINEVKMTSIRFVELVKSGDNVD